MVNKFYSDAEIVGKLTANSDVEIVGKLTANSDVEIVGKLTANSDVEIVGKLTFNQGSTNYLKLIQSTDFDDESEDINGIYFASSQEELDDNIWGALARRKNSTERDDRLYWCPNITDRTTVFKLICDTDLINALVIPKTAKSLFFTHHNELNFYQDSEHPLTPSEYNNYIIWLGYRDEYLYNSSESPQGFYKIPCMWHLGNGMGTLGTMKCADLITNTDAQARAEYDMSINTTIKKIYINNTFYTAAFNSSTGVLSFS